jgi:copper oxidase (laccase) domain-containing protein
MRKDPFSLLRPYVDCLAVAFFEKSDDIAGDSTAAEALGFPAAAGTHQVHGAQTVIVRGPLARTEQADGMITDTPGLLLCTRWADCQNFLIYAPERGVLGVLHAGWRGVIGGAVTGFYGVLHDEWGIEPAETLVCAGPSLCRQCADFTDPVSELPGFPPDLIQGKCADLQQAAHRQFLALGVQPEHFERDPDCTRHHPERYWTYRGGHRAEVQAKHTNMLACGLRA